MNPHSTVRACRGALLLGATAELGRRFAGMEGLPSDHYLRLTGEIGRLLRGERPVSDELP